MTATVVQLSSWALRCDLARADRSRGFMSDSRVCGAPLCVCACSVDEDTRVLPPKRHNR